MKEQKNIEKGTNTLPTTEPTKTPLLKIKTRNSIKAGVHPK